MAQIFERNLTGRREDLADLISVADSKSTPFSSMAPKGSKPGNTLMQWQVDAFDAATSAGTIDGTDVSSYDSTAANRAILSSYGQVFRRNVRVSPLTEEVANVAGVKSELSHGIAKRLIEIKRDLELTFLSVNGAQLDSGTVPYKTRGLGKWISTAANKDAVLPPPDAYCTPTASINTTATTATLTDTNIQDVLASIYGQTGTNRSYDMFLGTTLKRSFTNLLVNATTVVNNPTAVRTFNQEVTDKTITSVVDVFQGDFGTINLHPDTFMPDQKDGYIVPMDMVEIRYGKLPEVKELPDAGGGPARLIEAFAALVVKNPLAFGKFDLAS